MYTLYTLNWIGTDSNIATYNWKSPTIHLLGTDWKHFPYLLTIISKNICMYVCMYTPWQDILAETISH